MFRTERPRAFTENAGITALVAEEWQPGGDELTPTMKLERKAIDARHADTIDSLYEEEDQ